MKFGARIVAQLALLAVVSIAGRARADVVHPVRFGETLAAIADRYYGDISRESVLVAANVLNAQGGTSLLPGMRIVVPSVSYYRVERGDTWVRIAQNEIGGASRAQYLAQMNNANPMIMPSPGAVLRIPYLLRHVVTSDEPLFEVARRFYGDRSMVQFILRFNHLSSARLQRGQVLLLPIADLVLRNEPVCETAAPLAEANAVQRQIDRDVPNLQTLVSRGQYVEAVALGSRLLGAASLSAAQRVAVDGALAESFCALDRADLAAEAFRDALAADRAFTLDESTTSPKVLEAFAMARGLGGLRQIAPAPPTSRPDEAH